MEKKTCKKCVIMSGACLITLCIIGIIVIIPISVTIIPRDDWQAFSFIQTECTLLDVQEQNVTVCTPIPGTASDDCVHEFRCNYTLNYQTTNGLNLTESAFNFKHGDYSTTVNCNNYNTESAIIGDQYECWYNPYNEYQVTINNNITMDVIACLTAASACFFVFLCCTTTLCCIRCYSN